MALADEKQAVVLTSYGKHYKPNFDFLENTEVHFSCSLMWNGQMYVFGGYREKNQISLVTNCSLKRIASLSFDHSDGTCTVFGGAIIYLCFNIEGNYKKCRMADSPTGKFQEIKESTHPHRAIRLASSECKKSSFGSQYNFTSFQLLFL